MTSEPLWGQTEQDVQREVDRRRRYEVGATGAHSPEPKVNEWHARGIVLAPVDGRLHDPVLLNAFLRRVRMDYPNEKIYVAEDGVLRVTTYETENNVGPHLDWRD